MLLDDDIPTEVCINVAHLKHDMNLYGKWVFFYSVMLVQK